jgi:MFS family permease
LDIGTVVWSVYVEDWGLTYGQLNNAYAANLAGLAAGCILFIPFALKFGRRPVYLISTFVVFLCAVWQACLNDLANIIGSQVVSGLFGAIAEALCYMTVWEFDSLPIWPHRLTTKQIGDIFFVHQRGKATAITGFFTNVGVSPSSPVGRIRH